MKSTCGRSSFNVNKRVSGFCNELVLPDSRTGCSLKKSFARVLSSSAILDVVRIVSERRKNRLYLKIIAALKGWGTTPWFLVGGGREIRVGIGAVGMSGSDILEWGLIYTWPRDLDPCIGG